MAILDQGELRPVGEVAEGKSEASGLSRREVDPEGEQFFGHGAGSSDDEAVADLVRGEGEGDA